MSNKKVYEPIPKFNDHGSGCSSHENCMLDSTYETQEERDLITRCIDNYIEEE